MNDVIPGATYYDSAFGVRAICNGTFENEDGDLVVKLEYNGINGTVTVEYDIFREEEDIELVEHPK